MTRVGTLDFVPTCGSYLSCWMSQVHWTWMPWLGMMWKVSWWWLGATSARCTRVTHHNYMIVILLDHLTFHLLVWEFCLSAAFDMDLVMFMLDPSFLPWMHWSYPFALLKVMMPLFHKVATFRVFALSMLMLMYESSTPWQIWCCEAACSGYLILLMLQSSLSLLLSLSTLKYCCLYVSTSLNLSTISWSLVRLNLPQMMKFLFVASITWKENTPWSRYRSE